MQKILEIRWYQHFSTFIMNLLDSPLCFLSDDLIEVLLPQVSQAMYIRQYIFVDKNVECLARFSSLNPQMYLVLRGCIQKLLQDLKCKHLFYSVVFGVLLWMKMHTSSGLLSLSFVFRRLHVQ